MAIRKFKTAVWDEIQKEHVSVYSDTTAKKYAASLLMDAIETKREFWNEHDEDAYNMMTEREKIIVEKNIEKYIERIMEVLEAGLKEGGNAGDF